MFVIRPKINVSNWYNNIYELSFGENVNHKLILLINKFVYEKQLFGFWEEFFPFLCRDIYSALNKYTSCLDNH